MAFETTDILESAGYQSLKIPEDFKIDDDKVYIKKVGNALFVIPFHKPWENLENSVSEFTRDFMDDRGQPAVQQRENFD
ncbi:antitoxin [Salmonirosea aquatica]|uniref:AbrB/MazE/SpoVT family DNA-binding domain-containing protein n=1 Tax=Salmonirosea aquatica TaxID=2654236 RepID=A0A7C9BIF8_9BACT|nr:AbrB/MazE/SpoVT family DNA-binding domain-containing protein [Cytophagaceae bacterium SJW1-29]